MLGRGEGIGVPPALTNSANADTAGTSPAATSTAPTTRPAAQPGRGRRNRQRVINHGISPTTVPGPTTKNPALTTAAFDFRISNLLLNRMFSLPDTRLSSATNSPVTTASARALIRCTVVISRSTRASMPR